MIEGVVGVIIWTQDLDRLSAFYRETLGLEPYSEHPDSVSFRWGDMRLRVATHSHIEGLSKDPIRIMVNLGVTDIHAVHKALVAKGVSFSRPPEQEEWKGWVATFADPDGNTLQLLQQPS